MTGSEWYQQALTAPEVFELNVRIGVIPESDHAQALVEVKDPLTGVLIAQCSWPAEKATQWTALLQVVSRKAERLLGELIEPF